MRFIHIAARSAAALTFLLAVHADTLTLRDGRVINGRFLGANRYEIRFASDSGGLQRIDINAVNSISFGPNSDYSAAPPSAYGPPAPYRGRSGSVYDNWPGGQPSSSMPNAPMYGQQYPTRQDYGSSDRADRDRYATPPPAPVTPAPADPDQEPAATPDDAGAPPQYTSITSPNDYTIPAGATIFVRAVDPIDSDASQAGATFHASLDQPIVINGHMMAPVGSDALLQIVRLNPGGPITGKEEIGVALASISAGGRTYNLNTNVESFSSPGSRGRQSAEMIGGGAALGAIVGAVAGGGVGAAIGAGVGAAAGAGVEVLRGRHVRVPAETRLAFRLTHDVDL